MMNVWRLLWIIPVAASFGAVVLAVIAGGKE